MTHYDNLLLCPECSGSLVKQTAAYTCSKGHTFSCRDGRVYFTEPPVNYENPDAVSSPDPSTWSPWRTNNFKYFKRELAAPPKEQVVVDLGTGPGQFASLFSRFERFIGIDFRPYESVSLVADLTERLPLKDSSVDIVVASNTFEHLPDTGEALKEVARVLKPGGTILATIPFMMRVHQKPYDYNRYTSYQLTRLFEQSGFTNITIESLSKPHEVYATSERQFYRYLIESMQRQNRLLGLAGKVLWRMARFERSLLASLFKLPEANLDFTEGYGVKATKTA